MATEREDTIKGVREMMDFLEQNPDVPMPRFNIYVGCDTKAQMQAVVRCGKWQKGWGGDTMSVLKKFTGGATLTVFIDREQVCEKRQIGTRTVPAEPAREAYEEPVYEWTCEAILAPEEPSNA